MKLNKIVAVFSAVMTACSIHIVASAIGCDQYDGYVEAVAEEDIIVDLVDDILICILNTRMRFLKLCT